MSNHPLDLLVCYDIRKPRRLVRVHRCMRRWGTPLQYSVFYCQLTKKMQRILENELRSLIDERYDDVRIYGLKSNAVIHFMGQMPYPDGIAIIGSLPLQEISGVADDSR